MNRHRVLQRVAAGSALLTAGCTSLGEEPGAFNFAIVNRRERQYRVEYTVRNDDELVVEGFADVAASPPEEGDYAAVHFDDLTRVTNGDTVDVRVRVAGETYEGTYEVTCNRSETAENNFFFRIAIPTHQPRARREWSSWAVSDDGHRTDPRTDAIEYTVGPAASRR